jgi:DNA-binding response OmpR family regulator
MTPRKVLDVVVVEDDAVLAMAMAEMLTEMGHRVSAIAVTQADAVAAALRCSPDLLIVDSRLREGSGLSAVDEICLTRPIAHVFTTGDAASVLALRPQAIVIEKPFREADLVRAMHRALNNTFGHEAGAP